MSQQHYNNSTQNDFRMESTANTDANSNVGSSTQHAQHGQQFNQQSSHSNVGSSAQHSQQASQTMHMPNPHVDLRPNFNQNTTQQRNDDEDYGIDVEDEQLLNDISEQVLKLFYEAKEKSIPFTNLQELVLRTGLADPMIDEENTKKLHQKLSFVSSSHSTIFGQSRASELTNDKLKNDYNFTLNVGKMMERLFVVKTLSEMKDIINLVLNQSLFRKTLYDKSLDSNALNSMGNVEAKLSGTESVYAGNIVKEINKEKKHQKDNFVMQNFKQIKGGFRNNYNSKRKRGYDNSSNNNRGSYRNEGGKRFDYNSRNNSRNNDGDNKSNSSNL